MTGYRVDEVRDAAALPSHRDEWRSLVDAVPGCEIFQTWEWVTAWISTFWAPRPLAFLFVREGARLVGIVPLVEDVDGGLGCRGALTFPANAHVRRMDAICAAPAADVLRAALDHLRRSRGHVRLAFGACRADAPSTLALPATAAALGLATLQVPSFPSPVVHMDADFAAYLAGRPARVRHEIARKVRNGERRCGFRLQVLQSPDDMDRALQAIFAIEERSWKESAGTSFTAEAGLRSFYTAVARSFSDAGWLRIFVLHAGETPVAHLFGAIFGRQFFAIKTSYDEAFRAVSPGTILFHHALRHAFEGGLETFDFLGNPARWKDELANGERRHVRCCAFPRLDPRCRLCQLRERHVLPLARRALAAVARPEQHGGASRCW